MLKRILLLMAAMLLTASMAYAAPAALPKTGQITSFAAGDDGNLQKGVAWPDPRFTVSGDCVIDNLTGLMWVRDAHAGGRKAWQDALDYVSSLNSGDGFGGYTDWRLPNRKELRSLINYGQANSATWLNTQGFINVTDAWTKQPYWSSTTCAYNTDYAWRVYMTHGTMQIVIKTCNDCVWPVRSGGLFNYSDISVSLSLKDEPKKDEVKVKGEFTLNIDSDGINLLDEDVNLTVGNFNLIIPANSFEFDKHGNFKFVGLCNEVYVKEAKIEEKKDHDTYKFKINVEDTDLPIITVNPLRIELFIGDDKGVIDLLEGKVNFKQKHRN